MATGKIKLFCAVASFLASAFSAGGVVATEERLPFGRCLIHRSVEVLEARVFSVFHVVDLGSGEIAEVGYIYGGGFVAALAVNEAWDTALVGTRESAGTFHKITVYRLELSTGEKDVIFEREVVSAPAISLIYDASEGVFYFGWFCYSGDNPESDTESRKTYIYRYDLGGEAPVKYAEAKSFITLEGLAAPGSFLVTYASDSANPESEVRFAYFDKKNKRLIPLTFTPGGNEWKSHCVPYPAEGFEGGPIYYYEREDNFALVYIRDRASVTGYEVATEKIGELLFAYKVYYSHRYGAIVFTRLGGPRYHIGALSLRENALQYIELDKPWHGSFEYFVYVE